MSTFLLGVAGLGLLVGILAGVRGPRCWLGAVVTGALCALGAAIHTLVSGGVWEWRCPLTVGGQGVLLQLDALSALFLALLSLIGGVGALYARQYWDDKEHPRSAPAGRVWWCVLLLGLGLILLVRNGLHFLMAWELFAIAGYFLVTLDRRSPAVREAGWLYLAASHLATLCLFAFFGLWAARTGSWDLGPMRERVELAPLFWLALVGFGVKAGMFPLHVWLPAAHANAPSHVSAMLSGVTLKIGVYGLVRFGGWLPVPDSAGWVVAALGAISAVLGVAFALGQHDLKRLLAYHSVENIGIILLGLGVGMVAAGREAAPWGRLALAGALLHVWNHGLFKSLLFLGAGSVLHATGTREMSRLGGLWRRMPWTAGLFALGAAAISALPPLNGFVSEWLLFLGLTEAALTRGTVSWLAMPSVILLGMTGAMALACFVKVCGVVFLGCPRSECAAEAHECGAWMRGAMLLLAAGCVAVGLVPPVFAAGVMRAVGVWEPAWAGGDGPALLTALGQMHLALVGLGSLAVMWVARRMRRQGVRRAVTWDCGYAAPTARMQYTAGSFAAILTGWFAWILRTVRTEQPPEGPFPRRAWLECHTPETVLERVVQPAGRRVFWVVQLLRRLQHGRVQAYVAYILIGLLGLGALVGWTIR